ncbi:hypothetical protein, partial [Pseudoalteromonas marina]
ISFIDKASELTGYVTGKENKIVTIPSSKSRNTTAYSMYSYNNISAPPHINPENNNCNLKDEKTSS